MTNLDQVKDKVRKLMAVARNEAASDGEIENALRAAQALLIKYQLEEDDLGDGNPYRFNSQHAFTHGRQCSTWECSLATFVANFVGTVQVYSQSNVPYQVFVGDGHIKLKGAFYYYGPEDDIALAIGIFNELQRLTVSLARKKYRSLFRGRGRMYAEGFTAGLHSQLTRARKQLREESSNSRALVVQSDKHNQTMRAGGSEWLHREAGVSLTKLSRQSNPNSKEVYGHGFRDGKNTEVGGRQKKLAN